MEREFIDIPIQGIPQATKEEAKLMGLLNDYLLEYYAEYGNRNLYCELGGWSLFNVHETVIISKKFGFIKWLVKNDKIDLKEFHRLCGIINQDSEYWNGIPPEYEQVIMYLSISDTPIEDLISILK